MSDLPVEIWFLILMPMQPHTVSRLKRVSRFFRDMIADDSFWEHKWKHDILIPDLSIEPVGPYRSKEAEYYRRICHDINAFGQLEGILMWGQRLPVYHVCSEIKSVRYLYTNTSTLFTDFCQDITVSRQIDEYDILKVSIFTFITYRGKDLKLYIIRMISYNSFDLVLIPWEANDLIERLGIKKVSDVVFIYGRNFFNGYHVDRTKVKRLPA